MGAQLVLSFYVGLPSVFRVGPPCSVKTVWGHFMNILWTHLEVCFHGNGEACPSHHFAMNSLEFGVLWLHSRITALAFVQEPHHTGRCNG